MALKVLRLPLNLVYGLGHPAGLYVYADVLVRHLHLNQRPEQPMTESAATPPCCAVLC